MKGHHLADTPEDAKLVLDSFFPNGPWPASASDAMFGILGKSFYNSDAATWDAHLRTALQPLFAKLDSGELDALTEHPEGTLAYLIMCDQVARNIFRDTARAWAYDERAQKVAKAVVEDQKRLDAICNINPSWFYVLAHVFLHAEDAELQAFGREAWLKHAAKYKEHADAKGYETILLFTDAHMEPVEAFGRFPSRNRFLGREDTPDEAKAMAEGKIFGTPGFKMGTWKEAWLERTKVERGAD